MRGLADDEVCIGDQVPDRRGPVRGDAAEGRRASGSASGSIDAGSGAAGLAPPARLLLPVLREGAVRAGDEIVRVARGPRAMTVAEIDALLCLPGHPAQQVRAGRWISGAVGGLEGVVPRAGRPAGRRPGRGRRRAGRRESPACLAGVPPLAVTAIEPESRSVILAAAGRPGRGSAAGRRSRSVPDRPAAAAAGPAGAAAQLLDVRTAGCRVLPDQREARAARRGEPVHA